ncbi:extracellular tyrosine-protein kinase PKDCC-like [Protopterus annectens]|uniref:extracellular tyrosine-protein kinase PKDCC-like n=1 Tax=Protopterus annectens TaxID=7888 RepID=UPI001CFAE99C|nr:extracellular tyrosine-protein kinase PKDCC-like [Protopterus annectens]
MQQYYPSSTAAMRCSPSTATILLVGTALSVATVTVMGIAIVAAAASCSGWPMNGKLLSFLRPKQCGLLKEIWERHQELLTYGVNGKELGDEGASPRTTSALFGSVELLDDVARDNRVQLLGCDHLSNVSSLELIGSGYTKTVYKGVLPDGRTVALKSINVEGTDMRRCVQRYGNIDGCYRLAAYKLVKEVTLLQKLQHQGIISLQGKCYENSMAFRIRVISVLELGSPVDMIHLLQTPWEERFKVCMSLIKLLHYLAHSPLGSVALLDFQPRQFVLVDGNLKITDIDDATTEELTCTEDSDCKLEFPTRNFTLKCCPNGKCQGINAKRNIYNAFRYFFTYLLPHRAPYELQPFLNKIMNSTGDLLYDIDETNDAFDEILHLYKSGLYFTNTFQHLKGYQAYENVAVKDEPDYKCWPSYNLQGCLLSVHNAEEAAAICNSHPKCQCFVLTAQRTWTGRYLAWFRSGFTNLIPDRNSSVYIRMSNTSVPTI